MSGRSSRFQRFWLPGFAFKAVVIGGGYATGRELATFFLPSGPRGGLLAMLLTMVVWSVVCTVTFLFAVQTGSRDYRTFFGHLLGPLWPAFEVAWFLSVTLILAVFAAAAGAIGHAMLGWPDFVGALALMLGITLVALNGSDAVERLFKYATYFLYATYALFVYLGLTRFGAQSWAALTAPTPTTGWVSGGLMYAGYNILGAVVILPVVRHLAGPRDAVIAGALAGPLAILPALLFFVCMVAFYPGIGAEALPSDYLLAKLGISAFRAVFEAMVFAALLESATGGVHAINERIAHACRRATGKDLSRRSRLGVTLLIQISAVVVATRFGLVTLIARGYRWIAFAILLVYVLPLMTAGLWRVVRPHLPARYSVQKCFLLRK